MVASARWTAANSQEKRLCRKSRCDPSEWFQCSLGRKKTSSSQLSGLWGCSG